MFPTILRLLLLWLTLGLLMLPARGAQTLIPPNAIWRYLDTGTNLGTAWRGAEFDDSLWNSGAAQLGFGDGDEVTVINGGPSNARYRTTYFRSRFVIADLGALTNFAARLLRDDGAVVYVNGIEAFRQNMPEGPITANNLARSATDAPEESAFYLQALPPVFFQTGTNLVTVEVHQATAGSSDLSFALELLANSPLGNQLPVVTLAQPAAGAIILTNTPIVVQASAYDPDGAIQTLEILRDGVVIASSAGSSIKLTNSFTTTGTHTFTARATDTQGGVIAVTNGVGVRAAGQHLVVFPDFRSETNLVLQEDAFARDGRLHLNPENGGTGGAFIPVKQFVRDGFDVTFQYDIHGLVNSGGDGFAFVIQNNPFLRAGGAGGGMGYAGISNSLVVEFDTWGNPEAVDPNSNHLSVHTRGTLRNSEHQSNALATVSATLDGLHTVRILYTPGLLSVFLDNLAVPVLSVATNLATLFPLDFGRAWLGFTASTGAGIESHDILSCSVLTPEPIALRVTNLAPNMILTAPVSLLVRANATAVSGSVVRVEFYDDSVWFGETIGAGPFQAQWNTTRTGAHKIVAVGYDSLGNSISSEPVTVFVQAGDGRTTLVPPGSTWRHLDTGADQGTTWREPGFNDSYWRMGPAQLGFGDSDEVTVVNGGSSSSRNPTTYFRRELLITNLALVTNLAVRVLRDDGAVVHLNGNEIFRSAMPAGTISYGTFASSTASGSDETTNFYATAVNPELLVEGVNTLAVEIHQADLTSSDLSFDLELLANTPLGNQPPRVFLSGVTNGQVVAPDTVLTLLVTATDAETSVTNLRVFNNGVLLTNTSGAGATLVLSNAIGGIQRITARATDSTGLTGTLAAVTFVVLPEGADGFAFPRFSTNTPVLLQNAAAYVSERLRLTPNDAGGITGGAWWATPPVVTNGFEAMFSLRITGLTDQGGDGMAFVILGRTNPVVGASGGELGYGEVANSLAVEFDTWTTAGTTPYRQVSVHSGGSGLNYGAAAYALDETTAVPAFDDGADHVAKVIYRPGLLQVFVDNLVSPVLSVPVRLENLLDLPSGSAWIGFTAATGYDTENHDILDWSFAANLAPSVALTAPVNGSVLATNNAPLTATASDSGGRIVRVEFVGDGMLLGTRTNAPFTLTWTGVPEGAHTAFARAIDDQGVTNRAAPVTFGVATPPRLSDATRLPDGRFQMTFTTRVGLSYQVKFSEDLVDWFNAGPPLVGDGQPRTWIDNGPPLTPTPPQTTPHRFYKLIVLTAP